MQLMLTDKIKKLAEQFLSESERNETVHVPATDKLEALVEEALRSTATHSPELLKEFRELLGALPFIFITVRVEIGYAMRMLCRVGNKLTVSYLSKKQPTIAKASQEAEIYATSLRAWRPSTWRACTQRSRAGSSRRSTSASTTAAR